MPSLISQLSHKLQAVGLAGILRLFRELPPVKSSLLGGYIFKGIGPHLPYSKIAENNLNYIFPHSRPEERQYLIKDMWSNLGQNFGEFPHLHSFQEGTQRVGYEIEGRCYLQELKGYKGPIIFVSGHIGNWEIMPLAVARYGSEFATFYRRSNNNAINHLIQFYRERNMAPYHPPFFAKGAQGGQQAVQWLQNNGRLAMLIDQKLNGGIEVDFFNRPAMTTPTPAFLALRLQCPLIAAYSKRLGPARFKLIFEPPITLPSSKPTKESVYQLTQTLNNYLEKWIRKNPASWLWIHNRWKRKS